jgi:hypothetical protein
MATTFVEYTGDGNATKQFTFPSLQESDVKVRVDGVLKTTSTHYNITSYTTTGGGNVVFTSGNIPSSPANIRIYRDTNVDTAKATYTAGSSVKAADLNNNNTQLLYRSQEEQIPNLIHSYDIDAAAIETSNVKDSAVTTAKIAADAITSAKIADDSIDSEHYVDGSIDTQHIANENVTTAKLAADAVTASKLADNAVVTANIVDANVTHVKLANDAVDGDNIADDSINSEHYVDGSIDTAHIADAQITTAKLADGSVTDAKLAGGALDSRYYTETELDAGQLDNRYFTETELNAGQLDNRYFTETELTNGALDGRYFTETEADARYFNISTGDTIKDGDTFPDNDTTIATTAAINDRIIDLVDDVGGFVPIADETSFPTANPDVNNGSGTLVSIKAIGSTRTPSTGTVTIANGAGTGNTVTITGCGSTVLTAGFGVIVETTSTLHTYAFHRLVPKATEVTTVAGIASNITSVANNSSNINAVAADASDIGIVAADGTDIGLVAGSISNVNTTAGSISNVNTVASSISNVNSVGSNISNVNAVNSNESNINSAVSNASNINSAVSNASNINTVAGSISNVNTTAGSISNVNTVASNISNVSSFAATYQIASSAPSTDGAGNALAAGDLYFDTTANELRVHNGSTFQGGVTATGNLAGTGANTFTGNQSHGDNVKNIFGTGNDLEIYHNGSDSVIDEVGTGDLKIRNSGANKLIVSGTGIGVTGNITVSGNVDGRDVAADGTKLDGIATGATAFANVVEDTTPQLGGDLDVQSNKITTATTNGNVKIEPNGTGVVEVRGAGGNDGTLQLNCSAQSHGIKLKSPPHSAAQSYTLTFPSSIVNNGFLKTDSSGNLSFAAVNTDLVNDTSPQLGGDLDTNGNNIKFADNDILVVGTGNDLQIKHNGTKSEIRGATATNIDIKTAADFFVTHANTDGSGSENCIVARGDGTVELYYDGSKKFETTSAGTQVSGNLVCGTVTLSGGGLALADDDKVVCGNGDDLQIYHDGSHSYIKDAGTGRLKVLTSYFNVSNAADSEHIIEAIEDGAVKLYHNGSKKFETTSSGATVTGTVTATSFSGDGSNLSGIASFPSGTKMLFQQTSAPTGWTKVTSGVDNKALRVVSGTAGSGGSNAFSNTLASRSLTANSGNTTATGNISVANTTAGGNVSVANASTGGNVNSHTLTVAQMPSHNHNLNPSQGAYAVDTNIGGIARSSAGSSNNLGVNVGNTGGSGSHSHGFTGGSHNHNASFSGSAHNHNASFTGTAHNHSISVSNLDLAVQYLDVIIAAKD